MKAAIDELRCEIAHVRNVLKRDEAYAREPLRLGKMVASDYLDRLDGMLEDLENSVAFWKLLELAGAPAQEKVA
jgi:hypothetical protein